MVRPFDPIDNASSFPTLIGFADDERVAHVRFARAIVQRTIDVGKPSLLPSLVIAETRRSDKCIQRNVRLARLYFSNKGKARRGGGAGAGDAGGPEDDGDYATLRELPLITSLDPADDSTSEENKVFESFIVTTSEYYTVANRNRELRSTLSSMLAPMVATRCDSPCAPIGANAYAQSLLRSANVCIGDHRFERVSKLSLLRVIFSTYTCI